MNRRNGFLSRVPAFGKRISKGTNTFKNLSSNNNICNSNKTFYFCGLMVIVFIF